MPPIKTLAALGLLFYAFAAFAAEWVVAKHPLAPGYTVSNGQHTVNMPDEKSAEKAAEALNDADKAMEKKKKKDARKK